MHAQRPSTTSARIVDAIGGVFGNIDEARCATIGKRVAMDRPHRQTLQSVCGRSGDRRGIFGQRCCPLAEPSCRTNILNSTASLHLTTAVARLTVAAKSVGRLQAPRDVPPPVEAAFANRGVGSLGSTIGHAVGPSLTWRRWPSLIHTRHPAEPVTAVSLRPTGKRSHDISTNASPPSSKPPDNTKTSMPPSASM